MLNATTDALLAVAPARLNASVRGTLAFAVAFFGPLAANPGKLGESFDMLQAQEDGDAPLNVDPVTASTTLAFYRRKFADGDPTIAGYDPDRNLTKAGLPTPNAVHCGSKYVECPPGPCTTWEYDYQFLGLQESQIGKVAQHTLVPDAVMPGLENVDNKQFQNSHFFPMIGMPRCGPLFNYQYINVLNSDGTEYHPESITNPMAEFDKLLDVVPKDPDDITLRKYLPAAAGVEEVYGVPGVAMIPIPRGINYNPQWYFEGYADCFGTQNSRRPGAAISQSTTCNLETLLVNWLYNINPAPLQCGRMTKPPPYAPAGIDPSKPNTTVDPGAYPAASTGNAAFQPFINQTNLTATGNPRLVVVDIGTQDTIGKRPALIGYTRGFEHGYDWDDKLESYELLKTRELKNVDGNQGVAKHKAVIPDAATNWTNGRGPNHRITPQELPYDYDPMTCDFTQCRWVPEFAGEDKFRKKHSNDVDPWETAYACLATELGIPLPDDAFTNPAKYGISDKNNHFPHRDSPTNHYNATLAWLNRVKCYGDQHLEFVEQYVADQALIAQHDGVNVTVNNVQKLQLCVFDCDDIPGQYCTGNIDDGECANATAVELICCAHKEKIVPPGGQVQFHDDCMLDSGTTKSDVKIGDGDYETKLTSGPFQLEHGMKSDGVSAKVFDVELIAMNKSLGRAGCRAFYQRDRKVEIISTNDKTNVRGAGKCNIDGLTEHATYSPCFNMLGTTYTLGSSSKNKYGARQAVRKFDDARPTRVPTDQRRPLQHSRMGIYLTNDHVDRLFTRKAPGFEKMTCAADHDTFFYELGNLIPINDDSENRVPMHFFSMLNIPTRGKFDNNKPPTQNGNAANPIDQSSSSSCPFDYVEGSAECGPLILMAKHRKKFKSKYNPLEAYYAETRQAFPKPTASRQAVFPNSNKVTDGFACDCKNTQIVWRHLAVPTHDAKTLQAPAAVDVVQNNIYKSSIVVIRAFAWQTPQTETTPDVGLFLPSAHPQFTMVERDFLATMRGNPTNPQEIVNDDALNHIETFFAGVDAPRRDPLKTMVLSSDTVADNAQHVVNNAITFERGSCLRWPYGAVPKMAWKNQAAANHYYPQDKRTYGLEASVAYCENISAAVPKFTACVNDPLSPQERHRFCSTQHPKTARHIIYAAQIDPGLRTRDTACSEEHKTCIVVPGPEKDVGSLAEMLKAHHLHHHHNHNKLNNKNSGQGYTFLVTPFNSTILKLFLGPNRAFAPVAQGFDFTNTTGTSPIVPIDDADHNATGIATLKSAYEVFDHNQHSAEDIIAATTFIVNALTTHNGALRSCPPGEYRIPARSETIRRATECISKEDLFIGSKETGATISIPQSTIISAHPAMPIKFAPVSTAQSCVRITVKAGNVNIGSVEADQSQCAAMKNAPVVIDPEEPDDAQNITVQALSITNNANANQSPAQTAIIVAPKPPKIAVVHNLAVQNINITTTDQNVEHFHAAFAASFGENVRIAALKFQEPVNIILLPHNATNSQAINFTVDTAANAHIINLENTILEEGTAVLQSLFPTKPPPPHTIYIALAAAAAILVAALTVAIKTAKNIRATEAAETEKKAA